MRCLLATSLSKIWQCGGILVFVWFTYMVGIRRTSTLFPLERGACKVPKLDPWDRTVKKYLQTLPPIQCAPKSSLMHVNETGYLIYNASAISEYSLTSMRCVYRLVYRNGDKQVNFGASVTFKPPVFIRARDFRVICENSVNKVVYDFIHFNVAWNASAEKQTAVGYETDDELSIIVLGLDSVSSSDAIRRLPKTYKYLVDTLGAYDFKGYMKVGKNSFPNIFPLLTGTGGDSLLRRIFLLDKSNFIWRQKATQRYATLLAEDRPTISIFTFSHRGFSEPPVDYYYRPSSLAMSAAEPVIIDKLGKSSRECYGNKRHLILQIDYLKSFIRKYTGRLKFAFFWNNQLAHEEFNALQRGDEPMLDLLTWLYEGGHLDKTMLIVMSDHGFRLGGYSTTHVGRLENNMPFLAIRIPPRLQSKQKLLHKNLLQNTKRLVTVYDIHQTMLNVINLNFVEQDKSPIQNYVVSRSLFSEIPEYRTCEDAGIPPIFCTCLEKQLLDPSSKLIQKLASYVLNSINNLLDKYTHLCHQLELLNVTGANVAYSAAGDPDKRHINHYQTLLERFLQINSLEYTGRYELIFFTIPNNAMYLAVLDYQERPEDGQSNKVTLLGLPSRLDKYGNQSSCVKDESLREFCYCS